MAARYKSRAIAEYAPERIPELCGAVTGRSHASSAQGAWSDWVNDLPGNLPQLTPASMLMPLVAQLPPPDMRLPPKPIRRLDPAALRHFHLQAVAGAPPPATAIDGGPLPAQAVASQEAASSSLSGRSSADGSQKSVSRTEAISQLALSLVEARPQVSGCTSRRLHKPRHATHPPAHPPTHPPTHPPWVPVDSPHIDPRPHAVQDVPAEQWLSFPSNFKPSHVVKQLRGLVAQLEPLAEQHFEAGRIDAGLRDRFTQLADALRSYNDEKAEKAKRKQSADGELIGGEQPSAKRTKRG